MLGLDPKTDELKDITIQVASGLAYLHAQGTAHLNITTDSIKLLVSHEVMISGIGEAHPVNNDVMHHPQPKLSKLLK